MLCCARWLRDCEGLKPWPTEEQDSRTDRSVRGNSRRTLRVDAECVIAQAGLAGRGNRTTGCATERAYGRARRSDRTTGRHSGGRPHRCPGSHRRDRNRYDTVSRRGASRQLGRTLSRQRGKRGQTLLRSNPQTRPISASYSDPECLVRFPNQWKFSCRLYSSALPGAAARRRPVWPSRTGFLPSSGR